MGLTEGVRREIERIATDDDPGFGAAGFVAAQRRFGSPDAGDLALMQRALDKLAESSSGGS